MKSPSDSSPSAEKKEKIETERVVEAVDVTPQHIAPKKLIQKNSSIFFMYNGHEWEAHEVLGIPRGSDLQTATVMYQNLIKKSEPSSFEFFEAAYTSILKAKKNN